MTRILGPHFPQSLLGLANRVLADFGLEPLYEPLSINWLPSDVVVLWIIDGLGWSDLNEAFHRQDMPFWHTQGHSPDRLNKLGSVFPTTTVTALSTFHFARPPAHHGALGYTLWDPEILKTVNLLTSRDLMGTVCRSSIYDPRRTLYDELQHRQIMSTVISPGSHRGSALSAWWYHGASYFGYQSPSQIPGLVHRALAEQSRLIVVYWPGFDTISHIEGPADLSGHLELQLLDWILAKTQAQIPQEASGRFVITSDHGSIALAAPQHPTNPLLSRLYAGERRALYTAWSSGEVRRLCTEVGWDDAVIWPNEQLWDEGWFGGSPKDATFRLRMLQTTVLPPSNQQVIMPEPEPAIMAGGHGGWTEAERDIFVSWWPVH